MAIRLSCLQIGLGILPVEIVEVINAMRGPGKAELAHSDFMKKVERHPGIAAGNFSGSYSAGNGKQERCYYLPKREAELMVMSESLEVQTKVYEQVANLSSRFLNLENRLEKIWELSVGKDTPTPDSEKGDVTVAWLNKVVCTSGR
jgi:hypothetical protein